MNLKELYQEIILEHGKNPRNLRKTDNFTRDAKGNNPLCGDNVHIYLKLNENNNKTNKAIRGKKAAPNKKPTTKKPVKKVEPKKKSSTKKPVKKVAPKKKRVKK